MSMAQSSSSSGSGGSGDPLVVKEETNEFVDDGDSSVIEDGEDASSSSAEESSSTTAASETGSIDKSADRVAGEEVGSDTEEEIDFESDKVAAGEKDKKKKNKKGQKKKPKKDKKKDKKKKKKKKKKGGDGDEEEVEMERVCRCFPCKRKKQKPTVSLFRIYWSDKRQIPLLLLGVLAAIVHGIALPSFSIIFGEMFNSFGDSKDDIKDVAKIIAICFASLGVVTGIVVYLETVAFVTVGENICKKLRERLFDALMHKDVAFFDRHQSGEITSHLSGDIVTIQQGISDKVAQVLTVFAQLVFCIIVAFIYGWQLTLVLLALSPLVVLAGSVQAAFIKRSSKSGQEALNESTNIATEATSGFRTVLAFVMEDVITRRYFASLVKPTKMGRRRAQGMGIGLGFAFLVIFGTYALGFWYGANLVADDEMEMGDLLVVFFCIVVAATGLGQAGQAMPDITKGRVAATKVFELISYPTYIEPNAGTGVRLEEMRGNIQFKHVEFTYPARQDIKVYKDMNLRINDGEKIALVGPSGGGKSTVISLVMRFYDVNKGTLKISGTNIKDFDLYWLRNQIGLVSQEPILFSCTIAENILYGKQDATMDEVMEAAKAANAHEFVMRLPKGYDTTVGEKGCMLSGGQKQRIAIARAVLKDPRILLLDEATSALDTESEHLVQEALDKLMAGRTTIIIAHRLATVRNADRIAVMEAGEIVEMGSHDELLQTGKVYRHLVERQLARGDDYTEGKKEKKTRKTKKSKKAKAKPHKSDSQRKRKADAVAE